MVHLPDKPKPVSKKRLRHIADGLWMQACRKKWGDKCILGLGEAGPSHHFFPKGQCAHLRYDLDNGINISEGGHFRLHSTSDPDIIEKIKERREKIQPGWFKNLRKKAYERPNKSIQTVGWYRKNIEALKQYLDS